MAQTLKIRLRKWREISTWFATNNPVLLKGEDGVESDTLAVKNGDGETAWNDLPYSSEPLRGLARAIGTLEPAAPSLIVVGPDGAVDTYTAQLITIGALFASLVGAADAAAARDTLGLGTAPADIQSLLERMTEVENRLDAVEGEGA